jgi:hypothetical protein
MENIRMRSRMIRMMVACCTVALWVVAARDARAAKPAAAPALTAAQAFDKLRALAGTWEGTPLGDLDVRVTYRLAAGGSVVMETLFPGSDHEMISMYHLDGEDLVMTHYCSMGNQPHLKLDRAQSTADKLVFGFAGGTNFDPKRDGHIHSGTIDLSTPNALHASWAYYAGTRPMDTKEIDVRRKSD